MNTAASLNLNGHRATSPQERLAKPVPAPRAGSEHHGGTHTRAQAIAHNFRSFFAHKNAVLPSVTTLPVAELIAMLESADVAGKTFVVVSKPCGRLAAERHVTTVLDVTENKLYRATHETGMVCYWKGVAKRRPGVQFLQKGETFEQ